MTRAQRNQTRTPADSLTEMTEIVLPQHANALGTAFGGTVLSWVDVCGAIAAHRHCGHVAVTVAIEDVQFKAPIRLGDVVVLSGRVNAAFRTSVEVEVRVEREDPQTRARICCLDSLLTFVCIDGNGKPSPVPALKLVTAEDRRRAEEAGERRARRLARSKAD